MIKDPVCGIILDNKSPCKSAYAGRIHLFCCPSCKAKFDQEPEQYMAPDGAVPSGLRPPAALPTSAFLWASPLGHFLQAILPKSVPRETQGRPTWLTAGKHARDGR